MALSSQTLTVLQGTFGPGVAEELARLSSVIYVEPDGMVGIGNTSPHPYTLNVTGSVYAATSIASPLIGTPLGGLIQTSPSQPTSAGLNLPHGAAPDSPVDGDMWTTSSGLFVRIDGVTQQVAFEA